MHILSDGFVFHKSGNSILVKSISAQSPNKKKIKIKFQNKQNRKFSVISLLSRVQNGSCHVKNLKGSKKKKVIIILFSLFLNFAGHKRSDLHHRHAIGSSACRKEKNRFLYIELVFFFFTNNFCFRKKDPALLPNQMGKLRGSQRGTSSPD